MSTLRSVLQQDFPHSLQDVRLVIQLHNRNSCTCEPYVAYLHHVLSDLPGCSYCGHVHGDRRHNCQAEYRRRDGSIGVTPTCELTEQENARAFEWSSGSYYPRRKG